ncbi:Uncharacterized protein LOK49_LG14G02120 [Camellia lanceoleosa]|uniref:Uncharacterized protein n=1 Tax=Camellia lanceoleosa TaxID=1840588 RepID=A0ACC0F8Z8_9ERIC|nr:Uncharacterized protein LOK49_LG14G02120 [Camellia lanceoleosa]
MIFIERTLNYSTVTNQQHDQEEGNEAEKSREEEDLLERHSRKKGNVLDGLVSVTRSFKEALSSPFHLISSTKQPDLPPNVVVEEVSNSDSSIPSIALSKEEIDRIRNPWQNSLIVKLMGRSLGYTYLMDRLKNIWKLNSTFIGIDLGNHFFLMKFQDVADLNKVLNEGPWFVGRNFLAIRHWEPDFQPEKASLSTIVVWIRLHSLPIEYFDNQILRRIGNKLGKVLKVDFYTENRDRGRFARLCIQIDMAKPLIAKLLVGSILIKIAYEGINAICFHCGMIGHKSNECPSQVHTNQSSVKLDTATPSSSASDTFGPWMLVQRKGKQLKKPVPEK